MNGQAKQVKESREALGMSQEALAERAGVSVRTVRRAERGEVSSRTYARLMVKLQVKGKTNAGDAMENGTETTTALAVVEVGTEKLPAKVSADDMHKALDLAADILEDQWQGDWPPPSRGPDGLPRYFEQDEHLSSGNAVVTFIESYPTTAVYVQDDPEPNEPRDHIANFIDSVVGVKKAIRANGFDSRERFVAQCALADILESLHKAGWFVWGATQRRGKEYEAGDYKVAWTGHIDVTRTAPDSQYKRGC